MQRTLIKEISGIEKFKVAGFARNIRKHKGVIFVDLADISGSMQLVFEASNEAVYAIADTIALESVLEVSGLTKEKPAKKNETNPQREFEMLVEEAKILSVAEDNAPVSVLQKIDNEANMDLRLDNRFLDLRKPEGQLIFKVWTQLEFGIREYLNRANFMQVYTPSFMSTSSETGADVFEVKYFDRKAYLAQSPQFYKQMAMSAGFEKVFVTGPVFRAEKSFTTRHSTEFTGWDFEISYIESHHDIMTEEENMLVAGFKKLKETVLPDLEIPTQPFPRITLAEAKAKLKEAKVFSEREDDFSPEEEREICRLIKEETGHDFVFVIDYPITIRPFYHRRHENNPNLTKSFDLLYRGVEITTGAQREHRLDILSKQALEKGMNLEELKDYLNFFRYGCPPHGGAGVGPARLVMKILNLPNIKEATFLPRDVKRLNP